MKKLTRLLIAAALTVAAIVSVSSNAAAAIDWCLVCANIDGCYSCCRCHGQTDAVCREFCS